MIDWLVNLFTKPQIELSAVDKMAMVGVIVAGIILISTIVLGIWWIVDKIKQRKRKRKRK